MSLSIQQTRKIFFFIAAVSCFVFQPKLFSQEPLNSTDKIWLKNGSVFYGELIAITDTQIEFVLKSGNTIHLQRADVRKIVQFSPEKIASADQYIMFAEQDLRHTFKLDAGLGFTHIDNEILPSFEIGGSYLTGIGTSSLAGIRLNIKSVTNADYYSLPALEYQLEYMRFLGSPKKIHPYISMKGGVGHVISNTNVNNDGIRGLGIQPGGSIQLGLVKTIGAKSAFITEFGFNWQRYRYSTPSFWWGNGQRLESLTHLTLRIGYMF